ncbi:MAG: CDP-alcohol phosphatidyltransferase family protein [Lachnospiraceae bacterium]|nr:CDP-alcohol phosphatidyltransferase family protein [Lachnospiraceae bacterium]
MSNNIKDKLKKEDILTIPNFLSFFRILLIPVIAVLYSIYDSHIAAVVVIALSGLTDILDGKIARRFNMVSDFGKFIDPVADKLTQLAMILCLLAKYAGMQGLVILMVLKESFLFAFSYVTFKKTGVVNSARWYGKATTALLYAVMVVLFLFPNIPVTVADTLIFLCGAMIFVSMVLYSRLFFMSLKGNVKTV